MVGAGIGAASTAAMAGSLGAFMAQAVAMSTMGMMASALASQLAFENHLNDALNSIRASAGRSIAEAARG